MHVHALCAPSRPPRHVSRRLSKLDGGAFPFQSAQHTHRERGVEPHRFRLPGAEMVSLHDGRPRVAALGVYSPRNTFEEVLNYQRKFPVHFAHKRAETPLDVRIDRNAAISPRMTMPSGGLYRDNHKPTFRLPSGAYIFTGDERIQATWRDAVPQPSPRSLIKTELSTIATVPGGQPMQVTDPDTDLNMTIIVPAHIQVGQRFQFKAPPKPTGGSLAASRREARAHLNTITAERPAAGLESGYKYLPLDGGLIAPQLLDEGVQARLERARLQSPRARLHSPRAVAAVPPIGASEAQARGGGGGGSFGGYGYLDTEAGRLQASAHARQMGQTFLFQNNLAQAKVYLAKAEEMLHVDPDHLPRK